MKPNERDILLEAWMDEFGNVVLHTAKRILKNDQDAQDVFQSTFVKAYLKADGFNENEHVKAWLIRVATNESISKLRSGWKKRVVFCDVPERVIDLVPKESYVIEQIKRLSKKYREVLWLYYWAGYKTDEIAKMINISPATVRTQLKRARELLKPRIQRSIENENE